MIRCEIFFLGSVVTPANSIQNLTSFFVGKMSVSLEVLLDSVTDAISALGIPCVQPLLLFLFALSSSESFEHPSLSLALII